MKQDTNIKVTDHFLTKEEFHVSPTSTPGILKTEPVPSDLKKYYESQDYISHHQDKGGIKETVYKKFQQLNLNYKSNILSAYLPKKATVLDYGCGAGEFLKYIEDDFATFGLEPNDDARAAAERKTESTTLLQDLNILENNSLDAITLWHVFEHIENQQDTLEIFYNKLKTNGLLIIAVPNFRSFDAEYYNQFWAAYDVPRHIYHFSQEGMKELFINKKWNLKKIKPLLLDAFYISLMSEKYRKNPIFWLKGPIIGAISNLKASKTGEFSSLIYIIEKKRERRFLTSF